MAFDRKDMRTSRRRDNPNLTSLKIYGEQQYNALNKIHSIVFNLAQEGRISAEELEDYNRAGEAAFDALDKLRMLVRKAEEERRESVKGMHAKGLTEKKLKLVCEMIGLAEKGIEILTSYPLPFLEAVNKALIQQNVPIMGELHFRLIQWAWRWVVRNVDNDRRNIEAAKTWKQIYKSEHKEVREMAREMINAIASESGHIIDGLRQGKTFDELQNSITEHWYGQLSNYNFTGK